MPLTSWNKYEEEPMSSRDRSLRKGPSRRRRSGAPAVELLEDRVLLSVPGERDFGGLVIRQSPGSSGVGAPPTFGQLFYLDLDGARDVSYNGPITVSGIDVPAFRARGPLRGSEAEVIAALRGAARLRTRRGPSPVRRPPRRRCVQALHARRVRGRRGSRPHGRWEGHDLREVL